MYDGDSIVGIVGIVGKRQRLSGMNRAWNKGSEAHFGALQIDDDTHGGSVSDASNGMFEGAGIHVGAIEANGVNSDSNQFIERIERSGAESNDELGQRHGVGR
jgi:hypothetical protein